MNTDKSACAEMTTSNGKYWLMLVGIFLFLGASFTAYPGEHIESDPLQAIALFGIFAGFTLCYLPEYLRLRLWPWVAMSLLLALVAAIAVFIHNIPLMLICLFAGLGFLCLAHGLRWWKNRQQAKA